MKTCPFCKEEIQEKASKCKHCGSLLRLSDRLYAFGDSLSKGGSSAIGVGLFILLTIALVVFFWR